MTLSLDILSRYHHRSDPSSEDAPLLRSAARVSADILRDRARADILSLTNGESADMETATLPLDTAFFALVAATDALSRLLKSETLGAGDLGICETWQRPLLERWARGARASLAQSSAALLAAEPWVASGLGGCSASLGHLFSQLVGLSSRGSLDILREFPLHRGARGDTRVSSELSAKHSIDTMHRHSTKQV